MVFPNYLGAIRWDWVMRVCLCVKQRAFASCEILFLEKFSGKIFFKNAVKRFRIF